MNYKIDELTLNKLLKYWNESREMSIFNWTEKQMINLFIFFDQYQVDQNIYFGPLTRLAPKSYIQAIR